MSMNISRMTGLTSGMDIDGLVKQLMAAERIPYDKLEQKKQTLEWQREKYRETNTKLLEFRNFAFDMKLQSKYLSRTVTSDKSDAVTATAASGAIEGIYSIKVNALAKAAQLTSGSSVGAKSLTAKLSDLDPPFATETALTVRGDKGTARIELSGDDTIASLVSKINGNALKTGVRVNYDEVLDRFFFVSSVTGEKSKIDLMSDHEALLTNVFKLNASGTSSASRVTGTAVFGTETLVGGATFDSKNDVIDNSLNGSQTIRISRNGQNYDFAITDSTTIQNLIDRINVSGLKEQGVVASFSSTGKLAIYNPANNTPITFTNLSPVPSGDDNVLKTLGFDTVGTNPSYTSQIGNAESSIIDGTLTVSQKLRITFDDKEYDFAITPETTLGTLITNINTSDLGKAGVTAYMKEGRLVIFNPTDKDLTFSNSQPPAGGNDDANILVTLGLLDEDGESLPPVTGIPYFQAYKEGNDADIEFNGVQGLYSTNTFTINGITFTAKKETDEMTISVANDVDAVFNNIKSFVDKYNELISYLGEVTTEQRYREYTPLTSTQKEDMEDREIELWELRAKSGLLRGDSILTGAVNNFRTALYSQVQGLGESALKQLFDIGISTGTFSEQGKLYINENKLREAIAQRPDEVVALFTADDGNSTTTGSDGIAVRLLTYADATLNRLKEKAGTSTTVDTNTDIGKQLYALEEQMLKFTDRLSRLETMYYNQFTAMEKYLDQMNQQSMYLMQNFFNSR